MDNINKETLQLISNETKNSIDQLHIVTPTIYASIFEQFASNYNANIEDEKGLSKELLTIESLTLTNLQVEISKNVEILDLNTVKAIGAIQDKDERKLHEVLAETQKLKAEIEQLKISLYKDELTNIHNRKWLHDTYLDHDTRKFETEGILAIIDLNYFKIVNDIHGHILGDKVLIFIADRLQKSGFDVIRYGGDEFIMMFPEELTEKDALKILDEIREDILSKKIKGRGSSFIMSFSFGVAKYIKGDELSSIIEIADSNMYMDKKQIKKRVPSIDV